MTATTPAVTGLRRSAGVPAVAADLVYPPEASFTPDVFRLEDWTQPDPVEAFVPSREGVRRPTWLAAVEAVHSSDRSPLVVGLDLLAVTVVGRLSGLTPLLAAALAALAVIAAAYVGRVYQERDTVSTRGLSWYPGRVILPAVLVSLIGLLSGRVQSDHVLRFLPASLGVLVALRALAWMVVVTARRRGLGLRRTLIVGQAEAAAHLARRLVEFPEAGLKPIGMLPLRHVLVDDAMSSVIRATRADHVILVPETGDESQMAASLRRSDGVDAWFSMLPPLADLFLHPGSTTQVGGIPLVPLGRVLRGRSTFPGKRTLDVVLATLALVGLSPVLALAALAIRLDDGGPVFFRQRRVGYAGSTFGILKFRSMVPDADEVLEELRASEANVTDGLLFKQVDDPRVTRVGRFIRRTAIDELPQLWNVLRGEMSMVGPRPLAVMPQEFNALEGERHSAPPGITGYWQISGGNGLTYDEMVKLDLAYLHNWSLWLDIRLLVKTIPALLHRHGAV